MLLIWLSMGCAGEGAGEETVSQPRATLPLSDDPTALAEMCHVGDCPDWAIDVMQGVQSRLGEETLRYLLELDWEALPEEALAADPHVIASLEALVAELAPLGLGPGLQRGEFRVTERAMREFVRGMVRVALAVGLVSAGCRAGPLLCAVSLLAAALLVEDVLGATGDLAVLGPCVDPELAEKYGVDCATGAADAISVVGQGYCLASFGRDKKIDSVFLHDCGLFEQSKWASSGWLDWRAEVEGDDVFLRHDDRCLAGLSGEEPFTTPCDAFDMLDQKELGGETWIRWTIEPVEGGVRLRNGSDCLSGWVGEGKSASDDAFIYDCASFSAARGKWLAAEPGATIWNVWTLDPLK